MCASSEDESLGDRIEATVYRACQPWEAREAALVAAGLWAVPAAADGDGLRCPSEACSGRVAFVEDDPSFWGCGECGNVWFELDELYLDIEKISKLHDYRAQVYVKTPYGITPVASGVEPDGYDELVRKEWEVD